MHTIRPSTKTDHLPVTFVKKVNLVNALTSCLVATTITVATASVLPMATQRFSVEDYYFGRLADEKTSVTLACDPDGYFHRLLVGDMLGHIPAKILRIERNKFLLEEPYQENGNWKIRRVWHPILNPPDFLNKCPQIRNR